MGKPKRIAISLLSIGWIAPLSLAFAIGRGFVWQTYQIVIGQGDSMPWHPFELVNGLFYFAMLWLAVVIVSWSMWLTKNR
jgi:hypothetical protein